MRKSYPNAAQEKQTCFAHQMPHRVLELQWKCSGSYYKDLRFRPCYLKGLEVAAGVSLQLAIR